MAKTGESTDLVKCSFCRKSQKQVTKLVAGPNVYICNECINLCNDIIEQELAETTNVSASEGDVPWNVLTPPGSTDVSLNLRAIQQRIAALASEVQTLIYWIENPPDN